MNPLQRIPKVIWIFIICGLFFLVFFGPGFVRRPQKSQPIELIPEQQHQKEIDRQFSWDGKHFNLILAVKEQMHDPESFEHINTIYVDHGDYLQVTMQFRGANAFGAKVINTVQARVSLQGAIFDLSFL
jgi:hypothetical protein